MPADLDAIDIKILEQMQIDASRSTAEIANAVGLSQSPCWRRIQRLRDEGYIQAQVAIVDRKKLGLQMQIFAQLKMGKLSKKEREEFNRVVQNTPEILECHTVFGDMDVIIKVMAYDVNWYQEFVFETIMKMPGVQGIQSIVTLSETKNTTAVSLRGPRNE